MGSYIGPQLYPLKNFYRPLSQWALYMQRIDNDLLTLEVSGSWEKKIRGKLSGFCTFDLNYLYDLVEQEGLLFPIFDTGFQVNFLPVFNGRVSITNRNMELNDFYQTLSVSRAPFLSLAVHVKIDEIRLYGK